jgi:hypothetical protein
MNVTPDLICFHKQRCPILFKKIVSIQMINGLTCFYSSNLIDITKMKDFNELHSFFSGFNRECLTKGIDQSCLNSSYFYCNQSMKCILYNRVNDGIDELFDACQLNDTNVKEIEVNVY